MIPIHLDQIHNGPFIESCTHIWSDDVDRSQKSGVWDYYLEISERYNKPLINKSNLPESGIIFVGMCHLLEEVYQAIDKGKFIIIHRTNDRPYTAKMYSLKTSNIVHTYTVDCQVKVTDVSAIPFGNASINGHDPFIEQIVKEEVRQADTKLFVRYNVNGSTPHRNESLNILKSKPFAKVLETQIPQTDFYRECKAHKFTMALAGCGADASRQWSAIQLGSIPIVTDCIEMRHFEDLPLVYCPKNINDITEEWLNAQDVSNKSTERMRASYWINHIKNKRIEYGI